MISYLADLDPQRIVVWIAHAEGVPAGLNAIYLRQLMVGDRELTAGYWGHLFVLPEFRKAMIYPRLVLTMFQWAKQHALDMVYTATRRQEVALSHLKLGFRKVGDLAVLAKILRPATLMAKMMPILRPAAGYMGPIDGVWRGVKRVVRFAGTRGRDGLQFKASPFDDFALALINEETAGRMRTVWTLEDWHRRFATTIEGFPYQSCSVLHGNQMAGAAMTRLAVRGDGAVNVDVIMECVTTPGNPRLLRALLDKIEQQAESHRADAILMLEPTDENQARQFKSCGYWRTPERYSLLVWPAAILNELPEIQQLTNWRFSFAEHDAF